MPRYHFNIYDGVTKIDREGTTLSGIEEARRETLRFASELLREESDRDTLGKEWRLETTDGRGMILFRIDLIINESPAVAGRF